MTGRHHFRRGDGYHYNPIVLEYGRKILPQLFKRNNYKTLLVGKDQPCGTTMNANDPQGRISRGIIPEKKQNIKKYQNYHNLA